MRKRRYGRFMLGVVIVVIIVFIVIPYFVLRQAKFGKLPQGKRLERIEQSPQYSNGQFQNSSPITQAISQKPKLQVFFEFLFREKNPDLKPKTALPFIKTDLNNLDSNKDIMVWLGHSSIYLQLNGKRILVDPVLVTASPFSIFNKAFEGTEQYKPKDIPDIDYLILTHDHWDHLDYETVTQLKNRIGHVICPLGVGAHFEHWGFEDHQVSELDWNQDLELQKGIKITALPARHFSGRGPSANKSLWASYMLQSDFGNVFLSGDTGYDSHFKEIKEKFGKIDFAVLENGQYDLEWEDIHLMPEDLVRAIEDLDPDRVMGIHHGKYALSKHAWYEPMNWILEASQEYQFNLITPSMGEVIDLNNRNQVFHSWWK